MAEEAKQDFHGSVWGQATAALIAVVLTPVVLFLLGQLANANVPLWLYIAGIAVVALIVTVAYRPWRKAIWGNVAKWRPLTTVGMLERVRADGRAELQDEIDANRKRPITRAQWAVARDPEDRNLWHLANMAKDSVASQVSLDVVSSTSFRVISALDWDSINGESFGDFEGVVTENGMILGVQFLVSWTDANGVRQSARVQYGGF